MKISKMCLTTAFATLLLIWLLPLTLLASEITQPPEDNLRVSTAEHKISSEYANSMKAKPLLGGYYVWVQIEDCTSEGEYRACNNSSGYIVLVMTDGAEWHADLDAGFMDEANSVWTFAYGSNCCNTYFDDRTDKVNNENKPVFGFPKEVKLVTENDPKSKSYIKNRNKTYTSKWRIKLFVTGDLDKDPIQVDQWTEKTKAGGYWSDSKTVQSSDMPTPWHIANLRGPSEVGVPKEGEDPITAEYEVDIYDQYGSEWSLWCQNDNYITYKSALSASPDKGWGLFIECGEGHKGIYKITEKRLRNLDLVGDMTDTIIAIGPDGTTLRKDITIKWPKCKVYYLDKDGSLLKGPMEVYYYSIKDHSHIEEPIKWDYIHHQLFDFWYRQNDNNAYVLKDTYFYAQYKAEALHSLYCVESTRSHYCTQCRKTLSLSDKLEGSGSPDDPWLIGNAADWENVCNYIRGCYELPPNSYIALKNDIELTWLDNSDSRYQAGTSMRVAFNGNFDGRGHTIKLNCVRSGITDKFAPFGYIKNATIKNVKISGLIDTGYNSCPLVSYAYGTNLIENCEVSATLGNKIASAFLSDDKSESTTIKDCVFSGKIVPYSYSGIFIGFARENTSPRIINCLDFSTVDNPVVRFDPGDAVDCVTNSYHTNLYKHLYPKTVMGKLACDLRSADGIELTLTGDTGIQYNGRIYVSEGETFAFTAKKGGTRIDELMFTADTDNFEYLSADKNGVFTLNARSGVIGEYKKSLSLAGDGTQNTPYLIASTADWNELAEYVENGGKTSGLWFRLTNDISVSTMVGTTYPFLGSFDGSGHILSVDLSGEQYTAPFCKAGNDGTAVEIKDLCVTGSIDTSGKNAAGIVGRAVGTVNVINCVSGLCINSSVAGEGAHGGLAGCCESGSAVTIKGSVFCGKFLTSAGTTSCAGFVGQNKGSLDISDCVYDPQDAGDGSVVSSVGSSVFFRGDNGSVSGCYYTRAFGRSQGKARLSISEGDEFVSVKLNEPTGTALRSYDVSGIEVYSQGFTYSGECFFGEGDEAGFTVTHKDRSGYVFEGYKTDNGVLTGTDHSYKITMPDSDVTVCSDWTKVITVTDPMIELDGNSFVYCGKAIRPSVLSVKDGDVVIPQGEYEVSYSDNIDAGTATVTVSDKSGGYYEVSGMTTFTIDAKEVSLVWKDTEFAFDGKPHCPAAEAKGLIANDSCSVIVSGSKSAAGTHTAVATGLTNKNYKLPAESSVIFKITKPLVTPTQGPSGPTSKPTGKPVADPTTKPTGKPASDPTTKPAGKPTGKPVADPTAKPTGKPTGKPVADPTVKPTGKPTGKPAADPTTKPAGKPTGKPDVKPTTKPSADPTVKPTITSAAKPSKGEVPVIDKKSVSVSCGKTCVLKATVKGNAKISWKSSNPKVASVDRNGKVTAKTAGSVIISATAAGKSASCDVTVLYKDVTDSKAFWYKPTNYLTAANVVKGYDKQTLFKPANKCTRAQMVTFIWRLAGEPAPKADTCKFKDVKKTDYFYKACIWGNEKHIVEGYSDGTFGPQIVCARRHAVTFLWRLAGKPSPKTSNNPFKDVKKSDYFYKATLWASEKSILAGYSDGTFRPNGDCLRRQMVTFLYKYDKSINGKG